MTRRSIPLLPIAVAVALGAGIIPAGPAHARPAASAEAPGSTRTLYLGLIRQARADGRPRAALAYLNDFDRQHPGDIEALVLRVNCLLDLGQTDGAATALDQIPGNSRNAEARAIRGHVRAAQGAWADAADLYRTALAVDPANPLTGNALGYALLRAGMAAQAVEALKDAAQLAPANAVIRNNLALALAVDGRGPEADALIATIRDRPAQAALRGRIVEQAAQLAALADPVGQMGVIVP